MHTEYKCSQSRFRRRNFSPVGKTGGYFYRRMHFRQSAVLRLHVVRLWRGWIRLEILETNRTDNTFALPCRKAFTYSQGNNMRQFGEEVGWEKVACWSTEASISPKCVKVDEKLMEGLQELTDALSNGTIPDPLRPPFPKIGGSQPQPTTAIAIISRTGKATDCKFGR